MVAISLNNNEVNIYKRSVNDWQIVDILKGHDLRVTGVDWAPNTNRIVTCSSVNIPTSSPSPFTDDIVSVISHTVNGVGEVYFFVDLIYIIINGGLQA